MTAGILVFLLAELLGHAGKGLVLALLLFAAAIAVSLYQENERFIRSTLPDASASP
jgi:hypothetical protein